MSDIINAVVGAVCSPILQLEYLKSSFLIYRWGKKYVVNL